MARIKWLLCLLILGLSFSVSAQKDTYSIKGQVSDFNTNELLVGVSLKLNDRRANTQLDGAFAFKNIPAGTYRLSYGYVGYSHKDTTIVVNDNLNLNLQLANNSSVLSDVVILSRGNAESDAFARKTEKNAMGVVNVVSANAIQLSPDVTIANVLQRVSGVSLERSTSGEGRYAIIRGMDQRYNYTLVNGIKIPSPDNKYRYVPMDIFPSDLVERVEVHKTLTPDMEGDAVGGVVNMVMKNAPSDGLYLKASVSSGVSENLIKNGYDKFPVSAVNKESPYQLHGPGYSATPDDFTRKNYDYQHTSAPLNSFATLAIGNRFLDKKLGVMLGLSYQNVYKGYSSLYSPAEPLSTDGSFLVKQFNERQYSSHLIRTGGSLKMDYAINSKNTISLYGLYASLTEAQARITSDTLLSPPRTAFGNGEYYTFGRSLYQDQKIYNGTLQGDHRISDRFTLDWSAVYSRATNHLPDFGEYEYDGQVYEDHTQAPTRVQKFTREWWRNSDRDLAGYLNLHYASKITGLPYVISVGGMYRDKQRRNYYDAYTLNPTLINGTVEPWTGIDSVQWTVQNPMGTPSDANNYTAYEKIGAAYAMAKIAINKLEVIGGVRMENTQQGYNTNLSATIEGKTASYNYTDFLPSVNFKYLLNNQSNLRLIYFAAINRPGFFEPVPTHVQGDDFDEYGNFNIKHATAQNVDLRYELYTQGNGQLLVGAFYKYIQNPIEYGFVFTGTQTDVHYEPANYGNASNFGAELVFERYIGKFGFRGNYTYTHSSITTAKRQPYKDDNSQAQVRNIDETRPLQGQSGNLANAALLYKDSKHGTDIQFNWQFTGHRIAQVSPYYDMDYWMKDMHVFDFSAEQRLAKHISLFVKVQNLFNAKYQVYINKQPTNINIIPYQDIASGKMLSQRNETGRVYQLGIRFDLSKK